MSKKALQRLDGSISELTGDRKTAEIESSDELDHDNVALFTESEHVMRSTARVTGESGPVDSVQGVTHEREEPERGLIGGVLDKLKETAVTQANPESPNTQESMPAADDWYSQEMLGVTTAGPSGATSTVVGNICGSCGRNNPEAESYCENCGNKL
jgi:hypothetical protein